MRKRRVIVVGAGPAGLAAAWELARAGHEVTVLEQDAKYVGGLARTMSHNGFRFDVGAHRFFSKNPEICTWWRDRLPEDFVRVKRLTRILYRGHFFHYPLRAREALFGMGIWNVAACALSYLWRRIAPLRPERSFEDWVTNRFGDRLYRIFFKTYTEKVWGMPCSQISADWASQRIKGLSLMRAMVSAIRGQSGEETIKTLVNEFEYPRLGAGMLWEKTRDDIVGLGGRVLMGRTVHRIERNRNWVTAVRTMTASGNEEWWEADSFIVSMPLQDCVLSMTPALEEAAAQAAKRLFYRDFILVALVVKRADLFPDNWLYIHDPAVRVARIENYNNWSPEMSGHPDATCLELEYFCSKGDGLWLKPDAELLELAKRELSQLGLAKASEVADGCVVRVEKAYPVYDDNYRSNVGIIRGELARIENLQVAGRNGMHKYNNQDHSMLTGILAARNVAGEQHDLWRVNGDAEYQEEESTGGGRQVPEPIASTVSA